jgi:hypothetical protein
LALAASRGISAKEFEAQREADDRAYCEGQVAVRQRVFDEQYRRW